VRAGHPQDRLTELYIEALLVDEELADLVRDALEAGMIDELTACRGWWCIVESPIYGAKIAKLNRLFSVRCRSV